MAEENPALLIDLQLEYIEYTSVVGTDIKRWMETKKYGSPREISYEEYISSTYCSGDMALIFNGSYERSGDDEMQRQRRVDAANRWYDYFVENII